MLGGRYNGIAHVTVGNAKPKQENRTLSEQKTKIEAQPTVHVEQIVSSDEYYKINFFSQDIHKEYPKSKHIWFEIDYNGKTIHLDIGRHGHGLQPNKPSIHINGFQIDVERIACNAVDIFITD